ncbi:hypothetical protein NOR51B_1973 [Luminiphilus syltensis NOR5-1B]|uniref:Uncharacterized protein n=2 Tax=Luminiphilus TaxID=1341118 RepID=B8KV54_9GAMM|nr:hypothetical protein NOR51B_1973 [Luminiphilus syltensis NOR5-1B]
MSSGVLIALGIVLAVVAIRVLKHSAINQRIAGAVVLGGGLLAVGLGVQDTLATGTFLNVSGNSCSSTSTINVMSSTILEEGNSIENQCSIDIEIKSYDFTCTPPSVFVDDGAPVGTIIAAGATAGGRGPQGGTAYCDSGII